MQSSALIGFGQVLFLGFPGLPGAENASPFHELSLALQRQRSKFHKGPSLLVERCPVQEKDQNFPVPDVVGRIRNEINRLIIYGRHGMTRFSKW